MSLSYIVFQILIMTGFFKVTDSFPYPTFSVKMIYNIIHTAFSCSGNN